MFTRMVMKLCSFSNEDIDCRSATSSIDLSTDQSCRKPTISNMIEKMDFHEVSVEFDLPLTPPSSPVHVDMSTSCINIDTNSLDTSLEEIPISTYRKHVIKDCMWGPEEFSSSKNREHSYTRLYLGEPPLNRTMFDMTDLSSKFLSSVDPAEVFPNVSCVDERAQLRDLNSSESDDESDADVDVVTVEPKLGKKIYDFDSSSPEILSPPKTPDSEPTEIGGILIEGSIDIVESARPKLQNVSSVSSTCETSTKRHNRDASALQERFSRASHNVLERKRRNELKGKFYHLRDSIPELAGNKKVAKVVILKKAISYIDSIKEEHTGLQTEVQRQKKIQQDLRKRLALILKQKSAR